MDVRKQGACRRRPGTRECTVALRGVAVIAVTLAACNNRANSSAQAPPDTTATGTTVTRMIGSGGSSDAGTAQHIASATGFNSPEALVYAPATDFYYVSNVAGPVGIKSDTGFISRVSPDGHVDSLHFIQGGSHGVTLNAPMGSRVRGDTLFVLDIDVLRAFNVRTGRPLGTVDFSRLRPHVLNDFDWGPDGAIYVTDMGMFANPSGQPKPGAAMRILKAAPGARPVVALDSKALDTPDGIAWDASGKRFILTPFGGDTVESWAPGDRAPKAIVAGTGKFDGIEAEPDGTIYLTSWNSGSVFRLVGDSLVPVVNGLTSPSDVSMDTKRHRLGITEMTPGRMQIWTLPGPVVSSR
jgi:sugar lactone lactonase YvrE